MISLGWREWGSLYELGIPAIKMKVDTGARTSALHAFQVRRFKKGGKSRVRFSIHPLQRNKNLELECTADVHDIRFVTDSGGHREKRIIILTPLQLGDETWPIEVSLTRRDTMLFRMLLGRRAVRSRFLVDPAKSYLLGKELPQIYQTPEWALQKVPK